jgi:hypothetical protein
MTTKRPKTSKTAKPPRKPAKNPKKVDTTRLWLEVEYDPKRTDPESLAVALDRLLETALSTPGILDDYGDPTISPFRLADTDTPSDRHLELLGGQIRIYVGNDGAASIESGLQRIQLDETTGDVQQEPYDEEASEERESGQAYNGALDGLESLLLTLAAEGVLTPENQSRVDRAVQACLNALENQC